MDIRTANVQLDIASEQARLRNSIDGVHTGHYINSSAAQAISVSFVSFVSFLSFLSFVGG